MARFHRRATRTVAIACNFARGVSRGNSNAELAQMKLTSAGLTFVNFATICGLLLGMIFGGLGTGVAFTALILAAAFALFANF